MGADAVRGRRCAAAIIGADAVAIGCAGRDIAVGVGLDVACDGGELAIAAARGHALDLEAGLVGRVVTPRERDGRGEEFAAEGGKSYSNHY